MGAIGIGLLLLSFVTADTSLYVIELDLAILGIGLGLNTGPVNSVAVASVPPARSGTASGLLNTARMIGATLGVALMGTVFAHYSGQGAPSAFTTGSARRAAHRRRRRVARCADRLHRRARQCPRTPRLAATSVNRSTPAR